MHIVRHDSLGSNRYFKKLNLCSIFSKSTWQSSRTTEAINTRVITRHPLVNFREVYQADSFRGLGLSSLGVQAQHSSFPNFSSIKKWTRDIYEGYVSAVPEIIVALLAIRLILILILQSNAPRFEFTIHETQC